MNSISGHLIQWCTDLIGNWGVWGVFFLMILQSACIPVPSEAIMLFAGFAVSKGSMSLAAIVIAGVGGNIIGSSIAYSVGRFGGRPFVDRWGKYVLLSPHKLDIAERWFTRYGPVAVFFSRMIPIVCSFISLPAGAARMRPWKFGLFTLAGCVPWVLMLGWVGVKVGDNWQHIQGYLHYVDYVVLAAIAGLIVWLVARRWRRKGSTGTPGPVGEGRP